MIVVKVKYLKYIFKSIKIIIKCKFQEFFFLKLVVKTISIRSYLNLDTSNLNKSISAYAYSLHIFEKFLLPLVTNSM